MMWLRAAGRVLYNSRKGGECRYDARAHEVERQGGYRNGRR